MFLDPNNFNEIELSLDKIFLDPNNPRFSDEKEVLIDENKISDEVVQSNALDRIRKYGLNELIKSIISVGFLKIDRVVIRRIKDESDKFIVIEGNRRIAALKIIDKSKSEIPDITDDVIETIKKIPVLVYEGPEEDISWIIQGMRHISGIKEWKPFQHAQLLVKLEKKGIPPQVASSTLGIGPIIASRLIRAYYGYIQAKDHEEYGVYLTPNHFAYFNEVVFVKGVLREWLGWEDNARYFKNTDNLTKFLSWFVKVEEDTERKMKIDSAQELRDIVVNAMIDEPDLFKKFVLDENMTANGLQFELGKRNKVGEEEWYNKIEEFREEIEELSTIKMLDRKEEFIEVLSKLKDKLNIHIEILKKM